MNRGELARLTTLTSGTLSTAGGGSVVLNTDKKKEEIVGKLAGLVTVRPTYYTIVVVAQVIQDLPNGVQGSTRGVYDVGKDKIVAEQKLMATVKRDAFSNTFQVIRMDYVDD